MKAKYVSISVLLIALLLFAVTVTASMMIPANDKAKNNAKAPAHSPMIGDNWDLERVDFIHYAKPDSPGKGNKAPKGGDSCYKLMGVKWKSLPVGYVINPTNPDGLTEGFVTSAVSTSAETWDTATSTEIFNDAYTVDYTAQYGVQNFENAIAFGDYPENNVIAVTSVWFMRKGKQIVEFDMLFNTNYNWGDVTTNNLTVMDLQNIATHELGHAVGLDDIYTSTCSTVTMYGYSGYYDIEKRTLEQPDIAGLQKMYGI